MFLIRVPPPANPAARVTREQIHDERLARAPRDPLACVVARRRPRQEERGASVGGRARRLDPSAEQRERDRRSPRTGKILMRLPWEIPALALAALATACASVA